MKAHRHKLLLLVCFMLIALFIVNVYLQIEGARKHSSAISAPVIFFDVGTELCMLDNGRITKMLQIYDSSKQLREIVGYSEKPDLLMLLCDTDAGKKYFSLQDGRLMPVLYNPSDHKEVFRHGFFFYSKLDDDGVLWVFKYELGRTIILYFPDCAQHLTAGLHRNINAVLGLGIPGGEGGKYFSVRVRFAA
jgi:hypothetical protein